MVRSVNQDAHYRDPEQRYFIVADGMGGHAGGEEASKIAIETAQTFLDQHWDEEIETPELITNALLAANDAIIEDQEHNPQRADMGTTVVMILFRDGQAWSAHVGDSRLYRFRDGELKLLTEDDTWVARAIKLGQLTPDEARVHPLRHVLSHCLGRRDLRQINNISTQDVVVGDRLLLCSDGLTEEVSEQEITDCLMDKNTEEAPIALVELAKSNGGSDNITVILVETQE
jgi:protein phosphatase